MYYDGCLTITEQQERSIMRSMPPKAATENLARFFDVFSDNTRLRILSALSMKELCVADLSFILSMRQSTVSHQLRLLKDAKIVDCRRAGKLILYAVVNPFVNEVLLTGAKQFAQNAG